jgi:ABC-type polysaccharide/polyol phosphate transport system ATPase subunit
MSSNTAVSVNSVSKTYRVYSRPHHRVQQWWADKRNNGKIYCQEVKALQDISFEVQPGEAIAIIGRNGSGKSTLLQMITGNLATTSGTVHIQGSVSALLELGAGFNPDFSGRENLRLNAAIRGLSPEETTRLEPAIEKFADIGAFIDQPVRTYSSGMYVRLAFAVAVHIVPDVLIIDEALAVGDIFFQQKCYDHIANSMQGAAKILVTHDLPSITRLATRCIVIEDGNLIFDGDPLEAIELYTTRNLGAQSQARRAGMEQVEVQSISESLVEKSVEGAVWTLVEADDRTSDAEAFLVEAVAGEILETGKKFDSDVWTIETGQQVRISYRVRLGIEVKHPVFGYLVRDRVGNAVFGMNTITEDIKLNSLKPGHYQLQFAMTWPEVEPGEYGLMWGLGDGEHALFHTIVGWVQRTVSINSVAKRPVHGMINNNLESFEISSR